MSNNQTRVLLVDDNELNLFLLMDMLQGLDLIPIIAESGAEALEFASRHDFGLILLDMNMPDMDSYQILNKLANNPTTSQTPVIFMNPNLGDAQSQSHGSQLSPIDCVHKPINKKILLDKVTGYLKIHEQFSALSKYYSDKIRSNNPAPEGVLALNKLGNIIYANPTAVALLRTSLPKLVGLYFETLLERAHNDVVSNWQSSVLFHACKDHKITKVEHTLFWCADGHKLIVSFVAYPLHADDIPVPNVDIMIVFTEVENQKYSDEKLSSLIQFDPLTRLTNRESFREMVQVALESRVQGESLALMVWNIDHFDYLNESLGHEMGDQLLKAVAQRLANCIGNSSTLARLGGDEFALLIPGLINTRAAIANAHALLTVFKEPFLVGGNEIFASASAGIAMYPEAGSNVDELLRNADRALKSAKKDGRNNVKVFNDSMLQNTLASFELEHDLRYVLSRNELFLTYQPVINLDSDAISGVEVEMYWRHPRKGVLAASEFLPVAEEAGLMPAIGDWILSSACESRKIWQPDSQANELALRIKISQFQLLHRGFEQTLIKVLKSSAIPAKCLELEVIEANLSRENLSAFINVFKVINNLGVRIILDDVGSNYFSLVNIEGVVFHGVKLSPNFLESLPTNSRSDVVLKSVIDIAHEFGAEVIASLSNEDASKMSLLKELGCDKAQGTFFYQEMAANELQALLTQTIGR